MVARWMASLQYVCKQELSIFFIVTGLNTEFVTLCNGLNIAESGSAMATALSRQ